MKTAIASLLALGLAACNGAPPHEVPHGEAPRGLVKEASPAGGATKVAHPPAARAQVGQQRLDALAPHQARWLCRQELERYDHCAAAGLELPTREACESRRDSCEARYDTSRAWHACRDAAAQPPGSCPVTVDAYLQCLDAWAEQQYCDNAHMLIETPAACASVREQCAAYKDRFYQNGDPPACEPADPDDVPVDDDDDIHGLDPCRPAPDRFVVLGDSIASCFPGFGLLGDCSPRLIHAYLQEEIAPDVTFESYAIPGAVTADLATQMQFVESGPGHVFVWVYAIGNDLLGENRDVEGWLETWAQVFAHFSDPARFPDGVTFLLNTQYSPYDRCPDPPGDRTGISLEQEDRLVAFNHLLFLDPAEARDDTVAIDQYPDWLGHGRNANVGACPHCGVDNSSWMFDATHPNDAGHRHIAEKWEVAFEQMFDPACNL